MNIVDVSRTKIHLTDNTFSATLALADRRTAAAGVVAGRTSGTKTRCADIALPGDSGDAAYLRGGDLRTGEEEGKRKEVDLHGRGSGQESTIWYQ